MRIKSVTVRNYRIIRDQTVNFDQALTLIGGLNESGKSTLAEAIHRTLFLKAKGNTEEHRSMNSTLHGSPPEVDLTFECHGTPYVLKKRFGSGGSVSLSSQNSVTLRDDPAETELSRLINSETKLAGNEMKAQWAHLWVWQGCAGTNPSQFATEERDGLLQRLQQIGAAAALQSDNDTRVARHFAEAYNSLYTSGDNPKPKANSALRNAQETLESANRELQEKGELVNKLDSAVADLENATRDLKTAGDSLIKLETEQGEVDDKVQQLEVLRRSESDQHHALAAATAAYESIKSNDEKIRSYRQNINNLKQNLEPQQEKIAQLAQASEAAKKQAKLLGQAHLAASEAVRAARLRHNLASTHVALIEKTEVHGKLGEKADKIAVRQQDLSNLNGQIAKLPAVDKAIVKKLQKLETECSNAAAALQAMAAGLEVIAADQDVIVGGIRLEPGKKQILTEVTDVSLGAAFKLRIEPGGGTSLAEARTKEMEARSGLQKFLDAIPLKTTAEAVEALARHDELKSQANAILAEIQGMGADTIADDVQKALNDVTAAANQVDRLSALVGDIIKPADLAAAKASARDLETALSDAETKESIAKGEADDGAKKSESAETKLTGIRGEAEAQERELQTLRAQFELLVNTHGEDVPRSQHLVQAEAEKAAAEERLKKTRAAIASLQPDLLVGDQSRIKRALERTTNDRNTAHTRVAVAQNSLRFDGSSDPHAELAAAEARAGAARQHHASVQRGAEAVKMLNRLFLDEQRTLSDQFTGPLAEKISAYIQCVLGAGANARVGLEEQKFTGLKLLRPDGAGLLEFEQLSGGAKEQLAAAVRLAMAEVLAGGHDGSLPVVFDDAFTNSDPERVANVQRMLDVAASKNLQIIVLTCTPADYASLGATTVSLRSERKQQAGVASPATGLAPEESSNASGATNAVSAEPDSDLTVNAEVQDEFISALKELGGSSGNQALRERLDWADKRYEAVKNTLLGAGKISTGRGRGGSVAIA